MMTRNHFKSRAILTILLAYIMVACIQQKKDIPSTFTSFSNSEYLPYIIYNAFRKDCPREFSGRMMNEERFQDILKVKNMLPDVNDEYIAKISNYSFKQVRNKLKEFGFDWSRSSLVSVKVRQRSGDITERTEYHPSLNTQRLDLYLYITANGRTAVLKVDDTYKIQNKRYIAGGFRLQEYQ